MPTGLKPYSSKKPSGVGWLGEVPSHWTLTRLRATVNGCINGVWGNEPSGRDDLVCVRVADFDRERFRILLERKTMRAVIPNERARRLLKKGDLLLEKSGGGDLQPVGAVMLYEHDDLAVCSNFIARMPIASPHDSRYLAYLHSHLYALRLNVRSIKQTTGIQNLDSYSYLCERVALPSSNEQTAIARYLGHMDRRIQKYTRAKEKLIALLDEYKQALIHQAVTGQIDVRTGRPYTEYKESGVEWIGRVPGHWETKRLKSLVRRIDQGVSPQADNRLVDGNSWGVLKAGCVNGGVFQAQQHKRLPEKFDFDPALAVSNGDVLVSRASGSPNLVGSVGCVKELRYRLILSDKTFRPVFTRFVDSSFMVMAMNSSYYRKQVSQAISGAEGLANNLPLSALQRFFFAVPSFSEQREIARRVRECIDRIDSASACAARKNSLMREYRARLIADVVTGKLDVREATTSLRKTDSPVAESREA